MNGNGFQPCEKIRGHVEKDKVNINLVISKKKVFHTKPLILKGKLAPQGSRGAVTNPVINPNYGAFPITNGPT